MQTTYKQTTIGLIPNDWEVKKIMEVGDVSSGGTPDTNNPNFWGGDINWCTPTDITKLTTKFLEETSTKITIEGLKNSSAKILPPNSVIVCTRATIGKAAINNVPMSTNQGFKNVIPKKIDTNFLYYKIISEEKGLLKIANGSTFLEISKTDFDNYSISVPPLPEQKAIAHILGLMDAAINTNNQLIAQKEQRKKWLTQNLLTGKKRLKGFSKEWKRTKLETVSDIRRGASPRPIQNPKWFSEKGRGWIRISDVTSSNTYLNTTTQYLSDEGANKSVKVDKGDLIMSICATIGVPVIVNIPACIHDGFVLFKNYEKKLATFFLFYFLQYITEKLDGEGQPGTQKNLNTSIVGNIQIAIPSLKEQTAIAQILQTADKEIQLLKTKTDKLKEQKKGLMQVLLTGKKRVKI